MNNKESIGIFEFASLGDALRELPQENDILEIIPRGSRTTAILSGDAKALSYVKSVQKTIIESPHMSLMNSYLSLENNNFETVLIVVESFYIGDLFQLCNFYLLLGMKVVDFRTPRAEASSGCVILTSDHLPQSSYSNLNSNLRITVIDRLSDKVKEYFNIVP